MYKFAALLLFASLSLSPLAAQTSQGAQIRFQISGLKSPSAIIGYYYAGDLYRIDSVAVDTATGIFRLNKPSLVPGLYFVAVGTARLFDFMVTSPTERFPGARQRAAARLAHRRRLGGKFGVFPV